MTLVFSVMLLSMKKTGMFLSESVIKQKVDLRLALCTDGFEIIFEIGLC